MKVSQNKRWSLVSKTTGNTVRSYTSRARARFAKLPSQRIFDNLNQVFVR